MQDGAGFLHRLIGLQFLRQRWLGDVGRLHAEIKALSEAMAVLAPAVERLGLVRVEIDQAVAKAQKQFSRDANAMLEAHIESALHAFDARVEKTLNVELRRSITELRRALGRQVMVASALAALCARLASTAAITFLLLPSSGSQSSEPGSAVAPAAPAASANNSRASKH